jgi:hypothetical protein
MCNDDIYAAIKKIKNAHWKAKRTEEKQTSLSSDTGVL